MSNKSIAGAFKPGEYIQEEVDARDWSWNELAEKMCVSPILLEELMAGRISVTPVIAYALASAFGSTPEEWLRLQKTYDVATAPQIGATAPQIDNGEGTGDVK